MPSGPRIRGNNAFGVTTDNPLTIGATTMNSAGLAFLPAVASAHAVITLDPIRQHGDPEIVIVTAHTAASTVATITRGAYGTVARAHPQGTSWAHAPIDEDVTEILTSSTRPSDPYRGQTIFETDTNRYVGRSTADTWQQVGMFFDPPACLLFQSVSQNQTNNNTWQAVTFDTESYDPLGMHSTISNTSRITVPEAGIYLANVHIMFGPNITGLRAIALRKNGTGTSGPNVAGRAQTQHTLLNDNVRLTYSSVNKLAAGDWLEVLAFQNSGGTLAMPGSLVELEPFFGLTWIGRGN